METIHTPKWYRVLGSHVAGKAEKTVEGAWESYYQKDKAFWAERNFDPDALITKFSILYAATSHRAIMNADVGRVKGECGTGKFWMVEEE